MSKKIRIRMVTLGTVPYDLYLTKFDNWKSSIFEIVSPIENFTLNADSDGNDWQFTDSNISDHLPENDGENFLVALTNVPLHLNWYTRRVKNNYVVFTFNEIADYLRSNNIPLENVVYRLLYAYTLIYIENKKKIPSCDEYTNFTHDETRGCIFDMNGLKYDIIHSCDNPIICDACTHRLSSVGVSVSKIERAKKELTKVRKELYYRITSWISKHPILALFLATLWAIMIGLLTNYTSNLCWPST
ncbi:MAG: hypothetical protein AB2784_08025 [Candidatus Thiodiazotropha endolucinida]